MADSGIDWTNKTDNPTTGCDQVSPGCDNCYALGMAARLKAMGSPAYQVDGDPRTSGPGFALQMHPDRVVKMLNDARSAKKPAMHFVNSMSDLFHPKVTDEFLVDVFAVFAIGARTGQTYQVLTKRPKRMRHILSRESFRVSVSDAVARMTDFGMNGNDVLVDGGWPLPNVWLGTSVESQEYADRRIPDLVTTPAAVRFLSMEPLLERVDIGWYLMGKAHPTTAMGPGVGGMTPTAEPSPIQWVIVGGESGPRARPFDPDWARVIRDDCADLRVPMFMKQMGSVWAAQNGFRGKGNHPEEWPEPFPREYPAPL